MIQIFINILYEHAFDHDFQYSPKHFHATFHKKSCELFFSIDNSMNKLLYIKKPKNCSQTQSQSCMDNFFLGGRETKYLEILILKEYNPCLSDLVLSSIRFSHTFSYAFFLEVI